MALSYTKPAVRHAWADAPLSPSTDVVDPGDTYVSEGWQQGVKPPRPYFNWLLNYAAAGIRYYCQNGIPDYDSLELYQPGSVVYFNGVISQCLLANTTNVAPTATGNANWGPIASTTPAASDSSNNVANTSWVSANYLPKSATFASLGGQIAASQVPVGAVSQYQAALAIAFTQLTGTIANGQVPLAAVAQWQASLAIAFGQITGTVNAAQLGGLVLGPAASYAGNTVARYSSVGELYAAYFNQASANSENPAVSQIIVTNGTDNFFRKSTPANLLTYLAGAQSKASPGYVTLPGGIILQWGTASFNGSQSTVTASFPKVFPTTCLWASCICSLGGFTPGPGSFSASQLVMTTNGLGGTAQTFYWFALGY